MRVVTLADNLSEDTREAKVKKLLDRLNNVSPAKRERIKKVLATRRRYLNALHQRNVIGYTDRDYGQVMSGIQADVAAMEGIAKKLSPEQKAARKKKRKERIKKHLAKHKKFWSKIGKGFMFINLLPIRAAFNMVVALNINALATNLKWVWEDRNGKTKTEWNKILKVWSNVGGLKRALEKAISFQAKEKAAIHVEKIKEEI